MTYVNPNKELYINMAHQYGQFQFFFTKASYFVFLTSPQAGPLSKQYSERNLHFSSAVIFQLAFLPVTLRLGGKQSILEGILRNPLNSS